MHSASCVLERAQCMAAASGVGLYDHGLLQPVPLSSCSTIPALHAWRPHPGGYLYYHACCMRLGRQCTTCYPTMLAMHSGWCSSLGHMFAFVSGRLGFAAIHAPPPPTDTVRLPSRPACLGDGGGCMGGTACMDVTLPLLPAYILLLLLARCHAIGLGLGRERPPGVPPSLCVVLCVLSCCWVCCADSQVLANLR